MHLTGKTQHPPTLITSLFISDSCWVTASACGYRSRVWISRYREQRGRVREFENNFSIVVLSSARQRDASAEIFLYDYDASLSLSLSPPLPLLALVRMHLFAAQYDYSSARWFLETNVGTAHSRRLLWAKLPWNDGSKEDNGWPSLNRSQVEVGNLSDWR